jgi:hypothetical protein
MIKKRILYLILLSFILINVGQLGSYNNWFPIETLLTVHGGGGL